MREVTRTKALGALEGMRQIVRREMLARGNYVEDEISNPRLVGALCGGRKHCAVGSLWVGAGVRPRILFGSLELPGVLQSHRKRFLRRRPGLRVAYVALNAAAAEFAKRRHLRISDSPHWAPIEALFEGYYGSYLTKRDLLSIIAAAKRKVKAA